MLVPIESHREEAAVMPGGETDSGTGTIGGPSGESPDHAPGTLLLKRHFTGENLPLVRAQVEDTAAAAGLCGVRLGEFTLAVSEIAANAVEHAGGQGRLELRRLAHELECRITDNGPGFTPTLPELLPGLGTCPGRGLWLAHLVTDRMTVTTDITGAGAEVTLAVRLG
ncbi:MULTISPECIES: ATP-binding protein [Streptomyces]|uniref:Anti-sigma regulatory factor (Ser/Thr protein kinase) n=1 Tax=Streptomyces stelliscabiei TaxID=146820 RepID=A0A8I0TPJ6_9ACTN|nr:MULTISPECIES: ATP-binding protein [Streptomyces]KND45055.1 regulator of sigma factor [Streptomyces stelliscabiei]MBE1596885.1 anti-sigma regulatory factor (Ser/Thr protein kinase) [Streptomyces stelliscabiei]MDX2514816.1 ATP-binding protein [Streptomyces stelliscabiei]MDX2551443.1 ATP-binding protein [Streptomyces stelliscabiei]MDX2615014.1 ATP-binding protein [Streptomyces stelliscabiei]